ncbi:alpha/beta hydrolase family protein [Devosia nitrariae]|uniref:Dienelactone hydrolase domain-containing protein n=1 Tax=Devosia nitrariae TaxID=2071872 RepID=A0ABQ5W6V9_9HYPH|nr:dienelactone hydrolase family protein [Devosia nitrariae]GLQ55802.1 hypothetical protein GCM10010862_30610 [Devosia nitrariae]
MGQDKRDIFGRLLGYEPADLELAAATLIDVDGIVREDLSFRLADGSPVRGFLMRPQGHGPFPGLIYAHAHGGRYDIGASELTEGRQALLDAPGPALARAGYAALCIDMPTFGERAHVTESAASKAALWYGRTLFGQMLGEQAGAFTWLAARPDVDADRIGVLGMSMGATLAYWLAALDSRPAAIAHLCCYADFATLVQTGAHDGHGHYLTVPGLLAALTTGEIAGLVAPRPQLVCVGSEDSLTPPASVDRAEADTRAAYAASGAPENFVLTREAGVGHRETSAMRAAVLDFLARHLAG